MSRASRLPLILAATAGGVLVLCAGVAWRTGHAQRAWYILWEGDKKGRAKARNLGVSELVFTALQLQHYCL